MAHLTREELDHALSLLGPGSDIDARGTCFTARLLVELLDAFCDRDTAFSRIGRADFARAEFDEARFDGVEFGGEVVFDRAAFNGAASFRGTGFRAQAGFRDARCHGEADFAEAVFAGYTVFCGAEFHGNASFSCVFRKTVWFGPDTPSGAAARFLRDAHFAGARFGGDARFEGAELPGPVPMSMQDHLSERNQILRSIGNPTEFAAAALFGRAVFSGAAAFRGITFAGDARFDEAVFEEPAHFGAATFTGDADFTSAVFLRDSVFAGSEFKGEPKFSRAKARERADFRGAVLHKGGTLDLALAYDLDISDLSAGLSLAIQCEVGRDFEAWEVHAPHGLSLRLGGSICVNASKVHSNTRSSFSYKDGMLRLADVIFDTPATIKDSNMWSTPPRLLTLDRVDANNLTLIGLDLKACQFLSCYRRDQLRISGPLRPQFGWTAGTRFWPGRLVLADELMLRARYDRRRAWRFPDESRDPAHDLPMFIPGAKTGAAARHQAACVEEVYRNLRKGRESALDMRGAADFYYGEMEMRRLAAAPYGIERIILTIYRMISAYGLRIGRALVAMLFVIMLGAAGFATVGFAPSNPVESPSSRPGIVQPEHRPEWKAALYHSTVGAVPFPVPIQQAPCTPIGRVIQIGLKILGTFFAGLVIVSKARWAKR